MKNSRWFLFSLFLVVTTFLQAAPKPKLVVVISVDQLRADTLFRYEPWLLPAALKSGKPGGFRFLIKNGAYFPQAEYDHWFNMTGPGHSIMMTGANPSQTGITQNDWYSLSEKKSVNCVDDSKTAIVGGKGEGKSPRNMLAPTLTDEMKNAGIPTRVYSVALKDRAAIFLGGHRADGAFWYEAKSQNWVSSDFYFSDKVLPKAISQLNETSKDKPTAEELDTVKALTWTMTAAKTLVTEFKMGKGNTVDFLMLGLSSHDLVGHRFGPTDPEMSKMMLGEDRALSQFFGFLQTYLGHGLKDAVIVLTADHGVVPNVAEILESKRLEAGRLSMDALKEGLEAHWKSVFGKKEDWIARADDLLLFFSSEAMEKVKDEGEKIYDEGKKYLMAQPGILRVYTDKEISKMGSSQDPTEMRLYKSYYPGRDAQLVIVAKPYFFSGKDKANHMTGYVYDRTVPLILYGAGFKKQEMKSHASMIDLAPTLAAYLNVLAPAMSQGKILSEAFVP